MAPTLTSEAWTQIRYDYEHSERPIAEICAEHGISSGTLRDRMRRWGWRRRRPPIPREGPPALPAPAVEVALPLATARGFDVEGPSALREVSPHPAAHCVRGDPPHKSLRPGARKRGPGGEGQVGDRGEACAAPALPIAADEDPAPALETDDAALVPRLKGAVARVLPAIETIVARLAAGAMHPREMERAGRALGVLTRTLRELNGLLGERRTPAADAPASKPDENDDDAPKDMDEFRQELIRRINAIIAAREENAEGGTASEASPPFSGSEGSPRSGESETSRSPEETERTRAKPRGPQVRPL